MSNITNQTFRNFRKSLIFCRPHLEHWKLSDRIEYQLCINQLSSNQFSFSKPYQAYFLIAYMPLKFPVIISRSIFWPQAPSSRTIPGCFLPSQDTLVLHCSGSSDLTCGLSQSNVCNSKDLLLTGAYRWPWIFSNILDFPKIISNHYKLFYDLHMRIASSPLKSTQILLEALIWCVFFEFFPKPYFWGHMTFAKKFQD